MKTSADLGNRTRMSFSPKSLPDLTGFEVCTPVNSLREKVFSCCSNSLMGFPPVFGDPSKYSRISANCTQPEVWTRKPLCGLHQPVLSTGNCPVSFFMETISHETYPISTGCVLDILRLSLNPKGQRYGALSIKPSQLQMEAVGTSLMVLRSQCRGPGFDLWSGN